MSGLARRLTALERRHTSGPPAEDLHDARFAWPIRFARHRPENADLLARITAWRDMCCPRSYAPPDEFVDIWEVVACLGLEAGTGVYDGQMGLPPSPTAEQSMAIRLIEELATAANRYCDETGDRMPLPTC